MLYILLKNIIETTIQNYRCEVCSGSLQEISISIKKLSKRTGDVSVIEYIKKGYLPEALLNFLALLGWNPKTDQEVMTMDEMIEKFELTDIHKS